MELRETNKCSTNESANGRYNMELCKMAQEYRRNTALLELRK